MNNDFISRVVPGKSFIDVGPLWGEQKLTVARQYGAKQLTVIDIMPKDHFLWTKLTNELGSISQEVDYIQGDVCNIPDTISYDVVYCSGVLYHAPNPIGFIEKLYQLCNSYTILSTTYTDYFVANAQGTIKIVPGSALFLPAVPETLLKVLREDWRGFLNGRPGDVLSHPISQWDYKSFQHWWWLFTRDYLDHICKLVGFNIVDINVEHKIITFLLGK